MKPYRTQSDRDDYSEPEITTMDKVKEWWKDFGWKKPLLFGVLALSSGEGCGYATFKQVSNQFFMVNWFILTAILFVCFVITAGKKLSL